MNTPRLTCTAVLEIAPDAALDLLDGAERAAVVAHLDECASCRAAVVELLDVADLTLLLTPDDQPPLGFEDRVMASLKPSQATSPVGRWLVAAAIVIVVTLGAVATGLVVASHHSVSIPSEVAVVHTASGSDLGRVVVTGGEQPWLFMSLNDQSQGAYACQLVKADGTTVDLGEFDGDISRSDWSGKVPVPRDQIAGVRVTDAAGQTLGTATFD
jgi:hypothetical protein